MSQNAKNLNSKMPITQINEIGDANFNELNTLQVFQHFPDDES